MSIWRRSEGVDSEFDVPLEWTLEPRGGRTGQASVYVEEPDGTTWSSIGGSIHVQSRADGAASLTFTDVVFDKGRMITEPPVTRTVSSGSIVGRWIRR